MEMDHQKKPTDRLFHLDSLRGVAALCVVFVHCASLVSTNYYLMNTLGHAPVIFFFLLSGFVLGRSMEHRNICISSIISFYVRRLFRLYPAVFFTVIFAFLTSRYYLDPASVALKVPFSGILTDAKNSSSLHDIINNLTLSSFSLDHPLWTIKVEFLGSLLMPLMIVILEFFPMLTMPTIAILALVLGFGSLIGFPRKDIFAPGYFMLPFFLGIFIKSIFQKGGICFGVSVTKWALFFCFLLMLSVGFMTNVDALDCAYSIILGCFLLIMIPCSWAKLRSLLHLQQVRFLGQISYGIYLLQLPVICLIWSNLAKFHSSLLYSYHPAVAIGVLFVLTLVLVIPLAFVVERYLESPLNKIGHRLGRFVESWERGSV
jgi:peptidoglycan/LPS O-acetylase OafA/YrhL